MRTEAGSWKPTGSLAQRAITTVALAPILWLTFRALTDDLGAEPVRELELETGRWTLRLLAATLAVTPLRRLTGWNALVKSRRTLGLFAFAYATIHLLLWAGADYLFAIDQMAEEIVKHRYILVGMATWLLLLPLAVTSTKGWIRRLGGARWNRLHRLVYVAALGGTVHYLWAVKKDTLWPLLYLATFAVLLGVRVWWWRKRRLTG
ncbi:MAG TPA: protein-methionine-sulfoxide reductase heme-binding subunit MsrQ [Gemmatimonadaceae bacterium]|nr:protein-methionine-sulfoxide reductase heme-binding subunit MsrQ [Gemmatimonadaceae bacterium]